jgi:hypothetical protein
MTEHCTPDRSSSRAPVHLNVGSKNGFPPAQTLQASFLNGC